jgi:hypothetical protein
MQGFHDLDLPTNFLQKKNLHSSMNQPAVQFLAHSASGILDVVLVVGRLPLRGPTGRRRVELMMTHREWVGGNY